MSRLVDKGASVQTDEILLIEFGRGFDEIEGACPSCVVVFGQTMASESETRDPS